jgi:prepilin-type N-terminal cleavage/methylation domain-containing protein
MNVHPSSARPTRQGFTLIELLVVIVIIAILASLAVPVTSIVMRKTNELRTKATMKDLVVAINNYRTEYNRFPIDPAQAGGGDADMAPFYTDGTTDIINILMASMDAESAGSNNLNPRQIKFIDLPYAKNNQFGIIDPNGGAGGSSPIELVDIWGMPYTVYLDTNYDNRIENPDTSNNDQIISSRAPQYLSASVLIYSNGIDKQSQTKDDIVSWR